MLLCLPVLASIPRLAASAVLFAAWMALLFFGWTLGGTVYLLLLAAVILFPWKSLRQ